MSSQKRVTYDGGDAEVSWHGKLCIHVGECGRAQGELFVGGRQPWCQPDLASVDEVVAVVERCPTGALAFTRKDGGKEEVPSQRNTVVVANDGPLYLQGDLDIDGAADNMTGARFRAALCRCGESKNKPFCDNSHQQAGFRDSGAVGETGDSSNGAGSNGGGSNGGKLEVIRAKNGPLVVKGNLTIVTGSGREAWHGTKTALCRCGSSNNKPFCDGSHKDVGFEAD